MARRVHVSTILPGENKLDTAEAHHLRDVLRLESGAAIELFDDGGRVAPGIVHMVADGITIVVEQSDISQPAPARSLTIAAAIPKGNRAEWMIEKLSELGVARFVPLVTRRSVVVPAGRNKFDRWGRVAVESAKQSNRAGVMQIDAPCTLADAVKSAARNGIYLSTQSVAVALTTLLKSPATARHAPYFFIGPEGGWTDDELAAFASACIPAASLTQTILRVETAAIAAAAIAMCLAQVDSSEP